MTKANVRVTMDWDFATHNRANKISLWFCTVILHCPFVDWTEETLVETEKNEGDKIDHDKQDPVTEFAQFLSQWKATG